MNKKLLLLIGFCLAAMVLSNILDIAVLPNTPKPQVSDSHDYWQAVARSISHPLIIIVLPWAALLPLVLYLLRLYPLQYTKKFFFFLLHFSAIFLFSLGQIVVHMFFEPDTGFYHGDVLYRLVLGVIVYFENNLVFYICVIAGFFAVTLVRELRQKEINEARMAESMADARLSSLKMKLQPHFIFNALQSINVLMLDKQVEPASEMLSHLSRLLRHSIDMDDTQLVTVENEMEIIQNYLDIEEIRFKDRLKLEKFIEASANKAVLPGLILQPLIENAVKHGIAKSMKAGRIWIDIKRRGNLLKIMVKNEGPLLPPEWNFDQHSGFGLKATNNRLELIYGRGFSFRIRNDGDQKVSAEIEIPFSEEVLNFKGRSQV